ncbi:unnamed protein product [Symbiodinium pilosum]|uniref:Uncharacterized protein n=1 Tax=Symbiodinium pilosum TaxID=2952 RepID=A0A812T6Z3_SYMPI|nr:unnamed protein product [Symbiodinium pilosum]
MMAKGFLGAVVAASLSAQLVLADECESNSETSLLQGHFAQKGKQTEKESPSSLRQDKKWIYSGSTTIMSEEETAQYSSWFTSDLLPKWENRRLSSTWKLQTHVTIKQPAQAIFNAIMTSNMWPVCYPNTLSVGGFSHKPFTPETPPGMILEKFLWAGAFYSLFRYQVEDYQPPTFATFDGAIIFSVGDLIAQDAIDTIGGRFQYNLTEVGPNETNWTRTVYFYQDKSASLFQRTQFGTMMGTVIFPAQEKGAPQYVNCVKIFLETPGWEQELWGSSS